MTETAGTAAFLLKALREYAGLQEPRVLDFGCGQGALVSAFHDLGLQAQGCDYLQWLPTDETKRLPSRPDLKAIESSPYRLPFADDSFDAVVSTSVMEHAQNKPQAFREIHRVLKRGGCRCTFSPVSGICHWSHT